MAAVMGSLLAWPFGPPEVPENMPFHRALGAHGSNNLHRNT
jgi:hypothetical protein